MYSAGTKIHTLGTLLFFRCFQHHTDQLVYALVFRRRDRNDRYAKQRLHPVDIDKALIADWRRLSTSDHPYYMSTKYLNDGSVHGYFSPYDSPFDAFLYYMNVLRDIRERVEEHQTLKSEE